MTWKKRQQMTLDGKSTNHLEMQIDLRGKVSARGGGKKGGSRARTVTKQFRNIKRFFFNQCH